MGCPAAVSNPKKRNNRTPLNGCITLHIRIFLTPSVRSGSDIIVVTLNSGSRGTMASTSLFRVSRGRE